jgi:protein TonB
VYPRNARTAGWEGIVRISALVDKAGMVVSAEITSSSGHAVLDQAALEAVRQTSFLPARQDGASIECRVVVPIRFQLR